MTCVPHSERVTILGVSVDKVTQGETLDRVLAFVRSGHPHYAVTVNPEFVMAAGKDADFHDILNRADLALADGVGLLWASRWLGRPLPERVTGVDAVVALAGLARDHSYALYLLGAAPGVAERAAGRLVAQFPGLRIAGTYAGSPSVSQEDAIVKRVRLARPDLLLVAFGAPAQEKWIARNLSRLGIPFAMGIGGALDFIAGKSHRAPRFLQQLGLEWLYRLIREPWRWRRMLTLPRFAVRVLLEGRRHTPSHELIRRG